MSLLKIIDNFDKIFMFVVTMQTKIFIVIWQINEIFVRFWFAHNNIKGTILYGNVCLLLKMPKKQLTEFEKEKIIGFFEENISNREIAKRLQRSPQTINN